MALHDLHITITVDIDDIYNQLGLTRMTPEQETPILAALAEDAHPHINPRITHKITEHDRWNDQGITLSYSITTPCQTYEITQVRYLPWVARYYAINSNTRATKQIELTNPEFGKTLAEFVNAQIGSYK